MLIVPLPTAGGNAPSVHNVSVTLSAPCDQQFGTSVWTAREEETMKAFLQFTEMPCSKPKYALDQFLMNGRCNQVKSLEKEKIWGDE